MTESKLERTKSFLKDWSPLLAVIIATITALFFITEKLFEVDNLTENIPPIEADIGLLQEEVDVLQEHNVEELSQRLAGLEEKAFKALESERKQEPRQEAERARTELRRELQQEAELAYTELQRIKDRLKELDEQVQSLRSIKQQTDTLTSRQRDLEGTHDIDTSSIREQLTETGNEVSRLAGVLDVLKPIITESIAFGRIKRDTLEQLYTPDEIEAFVQDAKALVRERSTEDGEIRVRRGLLTENLDCQGFEGNCFRMSFLSKPNDTPTEVSISLFSGPYAEQLAKQLLNMPNSEELLMAGASSEASLCRWATDLLQSMQA